MSLCTKAHQACDDGVQIFALHHGCMCRCLTARSGSNGPAANSGDACAVPRLPLFSFIFSSFICARDTHVRLCVPVFRYGAKGDGETDDTRAVELAYAACASAGGGTVLFPHGRTFRTVRTRADFRLRVRDCHLPGPRVLL